MTFQEVIQHAETGAMRLSEDMVEAAVEALISSNGKLLEGIDDIDISVARKVIVGLPFAILDAVEHGDSEAFVMRLVRCIDSQQANGRYDPDLLRGPGKLVYEILTGQGLTLKVLERAPEYPTAGWPCLVWVRSNWRQSMNDSSQNDSEQDMYARLPFPSASVVANDLIATLQRGFSPTEFFAWADYYEQYERFWEFALNIRFRPQPFLRIIPRRWKTIKLYIRANESIDQETHYLVLGVDVGAFHCSSIPSVRKFISRIVSKAVK